MIKSYHDALLIFSVFFPCYYVTMSCRNYWPDVARISDTKLLTLSDGVELFNKILPASARAANLPIEIL